MTGFTRVLVANRGEIATRIIRACFDEGVESVLACSSADIDSLPAKMADRVVQIGPASPRDSYLDVARVVTAALVTGCSAVHPGYGFLSEQPRLAQACADNDIAFIGPSVDSLIRGGDKLVARALARDLGIPVSAGTDAIESIDEALALTDEIGFPIMVKAAAGGGGRGMGLIESRDELEDGLDRASNEAREAFGDGRLFLERYIARARHIEVQILADTHGNVVHLGERDCSVQRRYQKLIEEAPAFGLAPSLRDELARAAVTIARALDYVGAGTLEFLVDTQTSTFSFLEMNTRVQVEHPITEQITGVDIVRAQLRIAAGQHLGFSQDDVVLSGHAVEFRITAENPAAGFSPTPGVIREWVAPQGAGVRLDTHCFPGYSVPPYYDSLLGKLIVTGADRDEALAIGRRALEHFHVAGVSTTVGLHHAVVSDAGFIAGGVTTKWLENDFLPRWSPAAATPDGKS